MRVDLVPPRAMPKLLVTRAKTKPSGLLRVTLHPAYCREVSIELLGKVNTKSTPISAAGVQTPPDPHVKASLRSSVNQRNRRPAAPNHSSRGPI
jgi:hypothetical protein